MTQAAVRTLHGSHDTHLSEKEVAPHLCQRQSTSQDPPSKVSAAIPPSSSFTPGARTHLTPTPHPTPRRCSWGMGWEWLGKGL